MMQWHSNNTKFTLSQRGPECSTKKTPSPAEGIALPVADWASGYRTQQAPRACGLRL